MFSKPPGDAVKRYRDRRMWIIVPFVACMVVVSTINLAEMFADSAATGWAGVRTGTLILVGCFILIYLLDAGGMLHSYFAVKRVTAKSPIYLVGVAIKDWNANHLGIRHSFDHPNHLPYAFLVLEAKGITFRTGYLGKTDIKLEVQYHEISDVSVVRVSSVLSAGPGIRLRIKEESLDLQLLPLFGMPSSPVRRKTAANLANKIACQVERN